MPCYHPLPGWYSKDRNPSGKRSIVFTFANAYKDRPALVPCGNCIGCKLERARQWATRCMHEASQHADNCFVTLTYDDKHIPENGSLRPKDFVDFMKRLRWHHGDGIRFFHCGEYGEQLQRPHHHAILFNHNFTDLREYKTQGDRTLFKSKTLDKLWGHGMTSVGTVTFDSAGYVARYALKKVNGPGAKDHYQGKVPEYCTMSRRPGIGRTFIERYRRQIYRNDFVIVNGHESKPPRYYDTVQEREAPSIMHRVKARRRADATKSVDNTGQRLIVRETVKTAAITTLTRNLENGA